MKTLSLSTVGRLSLALAVFLALLAGGTLMAGRRTGAPVPAVPGLTAGQALAQAVSPAAAPAPNTIVVSGEGDATAAPDEARISLGVQVTGGSAREALDKASAATAAAIDAIKRAGVAEKDIQTVGISVSPITAQPRPGDQTPPAIVGYRASNTLNVTISSISNAGEVIDAAVSAGANVAGGIRFGIKDDAALRRTALDAAVRAARAKADTLAAAAGVRVVGVQSIAESDGGTPPVAVRAQLSADAAPAVPVQPGELTVRARVQVVYLFG